jgi:hypothetical protein
MYEYILNINNNKLSKLNFIVERQKSLSGKKEKITIFL